MGLNNGIFCAILEVNFKNKRMTAKQDYKKTNTNFLKFKGKQEGVVKLSNGVMYEIIKSGDGEMIPSRTSVIVVHYKGELLDGHVFDCSYDRDCPEALRIKDVISGWQIALSKMHKGDKWKVYIPAEEGYGKKKVDDIPGNSTLIFEIELIDIH